MSLEPQNTDANTQPDRIKEYNRKYWEAVQKNLSQQSKNMPKPNRKLAGNWKPLPKDPGEGFSK